MTGGQSRVLDELEHLQSGLSQLNHTFERSVDTGHADQEGTTQVTPNFLPLPEHLELSLFRLLMCVCLFWKVRLRKI